MYEGQFEIANLFSYFVLADRKLTAHKFSRTKSQGWRPLQRNFSHLQPKAMAMWREVTPMT
jgi:hypothetical protein